MSLQTLNSLLWNQRQLLETLLFKLEEEQLLLTSGRSRWLPRATTEVEAVVEQLREAELARAIESSSVCTELGIDPDAPLSEVAANAPAQWQDILAGHRVALIQLTSEIEQVSSSNRELLSSSQRAIAETLSHLEATTATYTEQGTATSVETNPRLFDQNL